MSTPLRVLFVNNLSGPPCGVGSFGRDMAAEIRRAHPDLTLTEWDGAYPAIYEKPYLPADAATYDLIHVNWHPVTLNHYAPEHFPVEVPLSVYLHDIPPWSSCPLWYRANHRWTAEPHFDCEELRYPAIADAVLSPEFLVPCTLGWTGLRGDGRDALVAWAEAHGWDVSLPPADRFATQREEIYRLSQCTLNVLWYTASGRGKSLALMTCAAARRPILVNDSSMFDVLDRYPHAAYRWSSKVFPYSLADALATLTRLIVVTPLFPGPDALADGESWHRAAARIRTTWESLCH